MNTKILSLLTLILLSACSSAPQKKEPQTDKNTTEVTSAKELNNTKEKVHHEIAAVTTPAPTGSSLYISKCASCHGKDAKKSALNVSKVIAGWSSEEIQAALKGYKDGSYGGKMKGLMQGQSKPLSDNDILLIADYISVL